MLPQLLLLRQTTVPTVLDSFYLVALGSYRAFYILNWIVRAADPEDTPGRSHPISIIFGVLQTALYLDFAWVFWSRQRVKLRGGGLVDSDDLRKGWLVSRVLGHNNLDVDEEEAAVPDAAAGAAVPKNGSRWGARGISISADEGDLDSPSNIANKDTSAARAHAGDEELAGILEEDEDDDGDNDGLLSGPAVDDGALEGMGGEREWREGNAR